jgi:hypothetical protein
MNIIRIEQGTGGIVRGKVWSSTTYSHMAVITLEDGSKTSYCMTRQRIRDLKSRMAQMPFDVQGAEVNGEMITINYNSNLL